MSWFSTIFIALITGILGVIVTGTIANACVHWYNISGFEGKAGYFVVFLALLGGFAGGIIGIVVSRVVAGGPDPSFIKGLGYSSASIAGIGLIATLLCRFFADIPPKIDGRELYVEIEFRMPPAETNAMTQGEWGFYLGSVVGNVQREAHKGDLKLDAARLENGQWINPGRVFLFTRRGHRLINLEQDKKTVVAYMMPLPARPGTKFEAWSEWLPHAMNGKEFPKDKPMYRFRLVREQLSEEQPSSEELEATRFAALKPDAPLEAWLIFLTYGAPEERVQAIMAVVEPRSAELVPMILSTNVESREFALAAVPKLANITPAISEALLTEAERIAEGIRLFNEMKAEDPRYYDVQGEYRSRFNRWKQAWWTTFHRLGLDGRAPVQKIHDLAKVRASGTSMDEIVINATAILDALPAATTNKP
jgi:hypothetical protein